MADETAPTSSQSDGRWRITYVPTGSNAKSVAILNGVTAKAITYGITPDGWAHDKQEATVEDKRLTMKQNLSRPGRLTETLAITVVASETADSADVIFAPLAIAGTEIQLVVRRAVANGATHAVGQKAELITGVLGVRKNTAPTENGIDTATYGFYFTKPTEDITLVA